MSRPTSIGRIVIFTFPTHRWNVDGNSDAAPELEPITEYRNNGATEVPAVIVRAWDDDLVNLQLLLDGEASITWRPSAYRQGVNSEVNEKLNGYWSWPVIS